MWPASQSQTSPINDTSHPNTTPKRHQIIIPEIPSLHIKLSEVPYPNYWEWATSIRLFLRLTKIGTHRAWDIIDGTFTKPATEVQEWEDANDLALLIIFENCEKDVQKHIGTYVLAKEVYGRLKARYNPTGYSPW